MNNERQTPPAWFAILLVLWVALIASGLMWVVVMFVNWLMP